MALRLVGWTLDDDGHRNSGNMSGQSRVPVESSRGSPASGSASQDPRIPVLIVFCDEAAAGRTVDVAGSVESGDGVNPEPVATAPAAVRSCVKSLVLQPLSVFDDETFYEAPAVSCSAEGRRLARLLHATHPEVHAEYRQTITEVGLTGLVKTSRA